MTAIAPVITIDGPSGAGKGTLCKAMAEALQWHLLDSGAIYRVLALAALHHHVDVASEDALVPLASHLDVRFVSTNGNLEVILEGEDVSAHRRMLQLQEKGFSVNFERLLAEIKERDDRDRNRAVAPLVPAADALVLDSTTLSIEQVIEKALQYARQKLALA